MYPILVIMCVDNNTTKASPDTGTISVSIYL